MMTKLDIPLKAEPEPEACGAGQRAECCIFLTARSEGFCCERWGSLHDALVRKQPHMRAKRMPEEPWPACMKFR